VGAFGDGGYHGVGGGCRKMIKLHGVETFTLPPNKGMQLTAKSVLSFAKRRAKARPLLPAADARG